MDKTERLPFTYGRSHDLQQWWTIQFHS
jgi:hypothetical protein